MNERLKPSSEFYETSVEEKHRSRLLSQMVVHRILTHEERAMHRIAVTLHHVQGLTKAELAHFYTVDLESRCLFRHTVKFNMSEPYPRGGPDANAPTLSETMLCVPLVPTSVLGAAVLEGELTNLELVPNLEGQGCNIKAASEGPWYRSFLPGKESEIDFLEEFDCCGEFHPHHLLTVPLYTGEKAPAAVIQVVNKRPENQLDGFRPFTFADEETLELLGGTCAMLLGKGDVKLRAQENGVIVSSLSSIGLEGALTRAELTHEVIQALLRGESERYVAQIISEMMGAQMMVVHLLTSMHVEKTTSQTSIAENSPSGSHLGSQPGSPALEPVVESVNETREVECLGYLFGHMSDGLSGGAVREEVWRGRMAQTIPLGGPGGRWDSNSNRGGSGGAGLIRTAFQSRKALVSSLVCDRQGAFDPEGLFSPHQDCPPEVLQAETLLAVPLIDWKGDCKGVATFVNRLGGRDHFHVNDEYHMRGVSELLIRFCTGQRPHRPKMSPNTTERAKLLLAQHTGLFKRMRLECLPSEEKIRFVLGSKVETVPRGGHILRDGDLPEQIFFVDCGVVNETIYAEGKKEGGARDMVKRHGAGSHFGAACVLDSVKSVTDFTAMVNSRIISVNKVPIDCMRCSLDFNTSCLFVF